MKTKRKNKFTNIFFIGLLLLLCSITQAQTLPYEIANNSKYPDNEVFIAIVGITDGHVWVDPVTSQVHPMDLSNNTVQGPVIGGNLGPGQDGKYANCFRRLSDIPNKTIQIPKIAGCRIMISFKSQLYLYFFGHSGSPSGYSAPNLTNPTDPNQGIKHELIELTLNNHGLWSNTSRVDSYQYPMGLEVWGDNFYKKVGELKKHNEIIAQWQTTAPNEFKNLLNPSEGAIHFPTKVEGFPKSFMDGYINDIWFKYSNEELAFTSDAGIWRGRVQNGNRFVFRRDSDGQIATISGKPTTLEAMEGSGVMASGARWDLVVQAQMVAAITRHAVDLNVSSGVLQNFGDTSKYYQTWPYNWYSKFFHQPEISFESQTYTFAYDDVYNQSATIHTPHPRKAKITIGGLDSRPQGFSTLIEAEDYVNSYQVKKEQCSEGGQNVGYLTNGSWMIWDIDIPSNDSYKVEYRVASPTNGGVIQLEKAGGQNIYGTISVPNTGGWQNWQTISHTTNLTAGTQQIAIYVPTAGYNVNWLKISSTNRSLETIKNRSKNNKQQLVVYPNPFDNQIKLEYSGKDAQITIFNNLGHKVASYNALPNTPIDLSNLAKGLYFAKVDIDGRIITKQLIKK
ncbi:beta-1,3-glucanase family protein [Aquimarina aquimarini]|uniref:beta-1,3-glucanase family protein n=1 Tax=Aquimarina aquimarini TaxID=1191734 RepID=UPI000D55F950|nr:beta-1,3-glucanase family protein [Aquimarina aquimarini]